MNIDSSVFIYTDLKKFDMYYEKLKKGNAYVSQGYILLNKQYPEYNRDLLLIVSVSDFEYVEEDGILTSCGFHHATHGVVVLWKYK